MAIKRAKRRTNFTMISNVGLRDKSLSYKAKGLLAYMLSLPDDWVFYETELVKHSTDGLASIKTGLKELQDNGYLVRKRERNEKGQLKATDWILNDEPTFENPTLEKPILENPTLEKPILENQPLLNTNLTKDLSKQSTDSTKNISSAELMDRFDSLWKLYPNKKGKASALKSYKKAVKDGISDEVIKSGIERYVEHLSRNNWLEPAHGSTWFKQERWTDEYEEVRSGGHGPTEYDDLF